MSNAAPQVGRGVLHLTFPAKGTNKATTTRLPFLITPFSIRFFPPGAPPEGARLFDIVGPQAAGATVSGRGTLLLNALSADPRDGFSGLQLQYSNEQYTLAIAASEPFGRTANSHFSDLQLAFSEQKSSGAPAVQGGVTLNLFADAVPLKAALSNERGLVFQFEKTAASQPVPVSGIGSITIDTLIVGAAADRWKNLRRLYTFDEGGGRQINDSAAANSPALDIKGPQDAFRWQDGSLAVKKGANIQAVGTGDLKAGIAASKEITLEAWVRPGPKSGSPATILSLTSANGNNVFTLSQDPDSGGFLITGLSFLSAPPGAAEPGAVAHVVFTREANGRERLFVNGILQADRQNATPLALPEGDLQLTLGNFPKKDHDWEGEYHQIALYDRALTQGEIFFHHYQTISLTGLFSIANAPAPLDRPLPASFHLFSAQASIAVDVQETLAIRPELRINSLPLTWTQSDSGDWSLSGTVPLTFWGHEVRLDAALSTSKTNPLFLLTSPKDTRPEIALGDWGRLPFTQIQLKSKKSGSKLSWELTSSTDEPFVALPTVNHRSFDVGVDFMLTNYQLGLTTDHLTLQGQWLGAALAFHGKRRGEDLLLLAARSLDRPFNLEVPALADKDTGALIAEAVRIEGETMHMELSLELGADGLQTAVNSHFQYNDRTGTTQQVSLPEFTLYTPPPSNNALLGQVIAELRSQIGRLLVPSFKNPADYYLVVRDQQPIIQLGNSAVPPETLRTVLPPLFPTTASVEVISEPAVFILRQSGKQTELLLQLQNRSQTDIDKAFADLWKKLFLQPAQPTHPGAAFLLRQRIAERLPLDYSRLLYYHYGWVAEDNYLDLQAGMRLRIDFQQYQFVQASDTRARNGFTGTGGIVLHLHQYARGSNGGAPAHLLGFDPFLSGLRLEGPADVLQSGAGGPADLLGASFRRAHFRLLYPAQLAGSEFPERSATLIGADNPATLNEATDTWLNSQGRTNAGAGWSSCFFRSRAAVAPEIPISIGNRTVYVPVGATLRWLLERQAGLPAPMAGQDLRSFLGDARPLRLLHEGVDSRPKHVFLNADTYQISTEGADTLDLPLLLGDRFHF